jgi:hypothetical protein
MMVPRKVCDLEPELQARRPGTPHPFVAGPAQLNVWFDAIIALMREKISLEGQASAALRR